MTKDDIIPSRTDVLSMAREAGISVFDTIKTVATDKDGLERFAAIAYASGAAAAKAEEREVCAKVCEEMFRRDRLATIECEAADECAAAIRARGQKHEKTL